jgi:phenylalanine-4-hydroxylase
MKTKDGLKAYGSGLLSSFGELEHAIESDEVQRQPLQLEWAVHQAFEIDHYQPLLFTVESFEQLYEFVGRLDRWMRDGRLSNVAPGEPRVNEHDLQSFLDAAV